MKKVLSFIGSWGTYFIGDFACKIIHARIKGKFVCDKPFFQKGIGEKVFNLLWEIYQNGMHSSCKIKDWGGCGPWRKPIKEDYEKLGLDVPEYLK